MRGKEREKEKERQRLREFVCVRERDRQTERQKDRESFMNTSTAAMHAPQVQGYLACRTLVMVLLQGPRRVRFLMSKYLSTKNI